MLEAERRPALPRVQIPTARLYQLVPYTGTMRTGEVLRLLLAAAPGRWWHGPAAAHHLAVWWSADMILWCRSPESEPLPAHRFPPLVGDVFAPWLGCWLRAAERRLWSATRLRVDDLPDDPGACPVVGAWGLWWRSEALRLVALLPRRRIALGRPTSSARDEALLVRFLGGGAIVVPQRGLAVADRPALWQCGLDDEAPMVVHPGRTDTAGPTLDEVEVAAAPAAQATA